MKELIKTIVFYVIGNILSTVFLGIVFQLGWNMFISTTFMVYTISLPVAIAVCWLVTVPFIPQTVYSIVNSYFEFEADDDNVVPQMLILARGVVTLLYVSYISIIFLILQLFA